MPLTQDLEGSVAVVTGGATGIGRATVLAFARRGAAVAVNYSKNEDAAQKTVKDALAAGGRALAVHADVSVDAQVRALMDRVASELGGIDYLVNNAGWTQRVLPHRDFEALTDEIWDRAWAVNVKAAFYCVRAAVPHTERRGSGSIVNVTSVSNRAGGGSSMAYAASKAALETLTLSLARALAPAIRVNAVAPGLIATGFGGFTAEQWNATAPKTPIGRLATADETAAAILGFVTNPGLTAQSVVVDGGMQALGLPVITSK